jgi:hypothetical protein
LLAHGGRVEKFDTGGIPGAGQDAGTVSNNVGLEQGRAITGNPDAEGIPQEGLLRYTQGEEALAVPPSGVGRPGNTQDLVRNLGMSVPAIALKVGTLGMLAHGGPVDGMSEFARALARRHGQMPALLDGGNVPGRAQVRGDSPRNDTVPTMLSPGEIVIPRSITQGPDAPNRAADFVRALQVKQEQKLRTARTVTPVAAPPVRPRPSSKAPRSRKASGIDLQTELARQLAARRRPGGQLGAALALRFLGGR